MAWTLVATDACWAQDVERIVAGDTDPTKPVLLSLRNNYTQFKDGQSADLVVVRFDRLILRGLDIPGPTRGLLNRLDLPFVVDFPAGDTPGFSDIYLQSVVVPRIRFGAVLGAGTGLLIPTASDRAFGTGKWVLAPALVPIWISQRKGFSYIKLQDWFSFAGKSDREDVHFFTVTGQVLRRLSKRWWGAAELETNTNWREDAQTWAKSGLLLGYMFNKRIGLSCKGELPFGQHRVGDWTVKAILVVTHY